MNMTNPFALVEILTKAIPGTIVSRWSANSDYEDIVLKDSHNNLYEIKVYPSKDEGSRI